MARREQSGHDDPTEVYAGLRDQILGLDPARAGIGPSADLPTVWGLMMETGYPNGTATLVALADGTTSMYFSSGGGVIGAGEYAQVARATRRLLEVTERYVPDMPPAAGDDALPAAGRVIVRALTYQGERGAEAAEDDLGHRRHVLSPVFHAAHEVITQIRILHEQRSAN